MEPQEYREKLKALELEYEKKRKILHVEYAMGTAKYGIGDIIKDNIKAILINKITVNKHWEELPEPVYHGIELAKDMKPKKKRNDASIYGNGHKNNPVELVKKADQV